MDIWWGSVWNSSPSDRLHTTYKVTLASLVHRAPVLCHDDFFSHSIICESSYTKSWLIYISGIIFHSSSKKKRKKEAMSIDWWTQVATYSNLMRIRSQTYQKLHANIIVSGWRRSIDNSLIYIGFVLLQLFWEMTCEWKERKLATQRPSHKRIALQEVCKMNY